MTKLLWDSQSCGLWMFMWSSAGCMETLGAGRFECLSLMLVEKLQACLQFKSITPPSKESYGKLAHKHRALKWKALGRTVLARETLCKNQCRGQAPVFASFPCGCAIVIVKIVPGKGCPLITCWICHLFIFHGLRYLTD